MIEDASLDSFGIVKVGLVATTEEAQPAAHEPHTRAGGAAVPRIGKGIDAAGFR